MIQKLARISKANLEIQDRGIQTLQLNGGKEVIFSKILADFPVGK